MRKIVFTFVVFVMGVSSVNACDRSSLTLSSNDVIIAQPVVLPFATRSSSVQRIVVSNRVGILGRLQNRLDTRAAVRANIAVQRAVQSNSSLRLEINSNSSQGLQLQQKKCDKCN